MILALVQLPEAKRSLPWVLLLLTLAAGQAEALTPRLWVSATPAAGVPIRSAPNFRVSAVNTAADVAIDIVQVNTDGTTTKLDTVTVTAAAPLSKAYASQNLAAIYWAYSKLPASSPSPPLVAVTFQNDSPSVALTDLYYPTPPHVPFAANDPSLLLDVDLRRGIPAGWLSSGTGTFDAVDGYRAGVASGSGLTATAISALSSTAQLPQGSAVVVFERSGVTIDNSFGTAFWDSVGSRHNAANRQVFTMHSSAGTWNLQARVLDTAFPQLQIRMLTPSMTKPSDTDWAYVNSHSMAGFQDPKFAVLLFTWYQNQFHLFFDGHLIAAGALGDVPIRQMFQNICIGNSDTTGVAGGSPFGDYAVQQVQISTRYLGPVMAGPLLGLIPDSFATAYTSRGAALPTGPNQTLQVSDVDAVQSALGLYRGIRSRFGQPGQTSAFHQIQAVMYQQYGFYPPIYNAGHPGHGYSLAPMDDAYIAALNRARPTIVMVGGTVNDVSPYTPADATLVADTESFMNRLSQGGGVRLAAAPNPQLEQIIYLETLSSQGLPSGGGYPEPAYGNESQKIISLTRQQLPGFKPADGALFSYVNSREWWNESADYATYLYGSAPANRFNAAGGKDHLNPHPDASGYSAIASHLYEPIRDAILNTVGADLAVQGTPITASGSSESLSLTVTNAGPATASGVLATSTLPAGVVLAGGSSPACTQSGNRLVCATSSLAAVGTATFAIQLQGSALPSGLAFSVGDANGVDSDTSNNSTQVALAPAVVVAPAPTPPPVATTPQAPTVPATPVSSAAPPAAATGTGGGGGVDWPFLLGLLAFVGLSALRRQAYSASRFN